LVATLVVIGGIVAIGIPQALLRFATELAHAALR
jgi:hypothetical protein